MVDYVCAGVVGVFVLQFCRHSRCGARGDRVAVSGEEWLLVVIGKTRLFVVVVGSWVRHWLRRSSER
ncbi:hypothetical protein TIFTF001_015465 [Ficus carica]|uniref:Uncharacterized protein n=1 Tax=Ficus carica TaxID=3494 RepID=A0AA88A5Q0_FICCA|nr:hypothetical protein TIFTF001_015465 [Ficus carica]